jgi:hypothetical protein
MERIEDPLVGASGSPAGSGWYMAWTRLANGVLNRGVYQCVGGPDGVACAPLGEETFLPTTHAFFRDALWRGPFRTERAAAVVNGFHRV